MTASFDHETLDVYKLEIARASAAECAASLDVIVARGPRSPTDAENGKILLHRIISILVRLSPPIP